MKLPVDVSLSLIDSIHTRWVAVVNAMAADQFALTFIHPELKTEMTLDHHLQLCLALAPSSGAHHGVRPARGMVRCRRGTGQGGRRRCAGHD